MEAVIAETFTRTVDSPYLAADGERCGCEVIVVLASGPPVEMLSVEGCPHVSEDRSLLWRALRGRTHYNPHVCRVQDEAARCPWCDGTGWYVRTAYHKKPAGLHSCDGCAESKMGKDLDFVPCSYCRSTGQRAA